jgi:hypothetical protein
MSKIGQTIIEMEQQVASKEYQALKRFAIKSVQPKPQMPIQLDMFNAVKVVRNR